MLCYRYGACTTMSCNWVARCSTLQQETRQWTWHFSKQPGAIVQVFVYMCTCNTSVTLFFSYQSSFIKPIYVFFLLTPCFFPYFQVSHYEQFSLNFLIQLTYAMDVLMNQTFISSTHEFFQRSAGRFVIQLFDMASGRWELVDPWVLNGWRIEDANGCWMAIAWRIFRDYLMAITNISIYLYLSYLSDLIWSCFNRNLTYLIKPTLIYLS